LLCYWPGRRSEHFASGRLVSHLEWRASPREALGVDSRFRAQFSLASGMFLAIDTARTELNSSPSQLQASAPPYPPPPVKFAADVLTSPVSVSISMGYVRRQQSCSGHKGRRAKRPALGGLYPVCSATLAQKSNQNMPDSF
jgi:hypothetical protein